MRKEKSICIHAHFNQPGRENPWLEEVEQQDSAHPYHNWNRRVADECYLPNMAARLLDDQGNISEIVNNYEDISFDFSPVLLNWISRVHPELLDCIQAADKAAALKHNGHGSALAHPYVHAVLPLMPPDHCRTVIRWGLEHFRHIFKRPPEGFWLPEMAVSIPVLQMLCDENIRFSMLSTAQISHIRWPGEHWSPVDDRYLHMSFPCKVVLPDKRGIVVFLHNSDLAGEIRSHALLQDGGFMARRLVETGQPLAYIATDGEYYGHHHSRGEMALAYCIRKLKQMKDTQLVTPGEYLDFCDALPEARIIDNTSWSCPHGLARWERLCACAGKESGDARWKSALRGTLDWLSETLFQIYEEESSRNDVEDSRELMQNYIQLIMDRTPGLMNRWFNKYAPCVRGSELRVRILKLLEMQRHSLSMYESALWLSGDTSSGEAITTLQHASRAIQLVRESTGINLEQPFIRLLGRVPVNEPGISSAAEVYGRFVAPAAIDLHRLGAHYAISSLFEDNTESRKLYCYNVSSRSADRLEYGSNRLLTGLIRVRTEITREHLNLYYSVIHLGDHNLICGVKSFNRRSDYMDITETIKDCFRKRDIPGVMSIMRSHFHDNIYYLRHLFRREQRIIVSRILEQQLLDSEALYRLVFERNYPTMRLLSDLMIPQPHIFATTMEFIMGRNLLRVIEDPDIPPERILITRDDCRLWNVNLYTEDIRFACTGRLNHTLNALFTDPLNNARMAQALELVRVLTSQPFSSNPWRAQNRIFEIHRLHTDNMAARSAEGDQSAQHWLDLFTQLQAALGMILS